MTGTSDRGVNRRSDRADAAAVASRLREETASPRVVVLPDGSVDRRCRVRVGVDERIGSRARFVRELTAGGRTAFRLEVRREEPGGQAVNLARQAHALGARTGLFGHLDGLPAFPFEAVSMGAPAEVQVLQFADGDLALVEESGDLRTWGLADLRTAAGGLDRVADADAVCWTNWVSTPGVAGAVERFAAGTDGGGAWFLVDPGDVVGGDPTTLDGFRDALDAVSGSYRPVLSVNPAELRAFAAACEADAEGVRERARSVREATGTAAVVSHGVDRAVAATPEGDAVARNRDLASRARETGGGDRFDAGLVYALAAGWDWVDALALGNACASRYVATGRTDGPEALADWVESGGQK